MTGVRMPVMGAMIDQVFYTDGSGYSTDETLVEFTKGFSRYFRRILFIGRVRPGSAPYALDPAHFDVIPLPYYASLYGIYRQYHSLSRAIDRIYCANRDGIDVFWLRGPHPVSLRFAELCRRDAKPFFLVVGQNLYAQVAARPASPQKLVALAYIKWLEARYRSLARKHLTFTVGHDLFRKYSTGGNTVVPITSSLVDRESIVRSRETRGAARPRPQDRITLLAVGRIEPEKGLPLLIDALALLRRRDGKYHLRIVGTGSVQGSVMRHARNSGMSDFVEFTGYVAFGPQLESIYRGSDVFVLPSLSEGFPRVIVEAMAHGLPVVATKVGGIPLALRDGHDSLLVEPGSAEQIAAAVIGLEDGARREQLVARGYDTALTMTAESQRELVYSNIIKHFPQLAT